MRTSLSWHLQGILWKFSPADDRTMWGDSDISCWLISRQDRIITQSGTYEVYVMRTRSRWKGNVYATCVGFDAAEHRCRLKIAAQQHQVRGVILIWPEVNVQAIMKQKVNKNFCLCLSSCKSPPLCCCGFWQRWLHLYACVCVCIWKLWTHSAH